MHRSITIRGLLVATLACAATILLVCTMVLGFTGASSASTVTGTLGTILLAAWIVTVNIRRPRRDAVVPSPLVKTAQP
jgi:hypothetical protein